MSQPPTKKYPAECKERAVKRAVESDQSIAQTILRTANDPASLAGCFPGLLQPRVAQEMWEHSVCLLQSATMLTRP